MAVVLVIVVGGSYSDGWLFIDPSLMRPHRRLGPMTPQQRSETFPGGRAMSQGMSQVSDLFF